MVHRITAAYIFVHIYRKEKNFALSLLPRIVVAAVVVDVVVVVLHRNKKSHLQNLGQRPNAKSQVTIKLHFFCSVLGLQQSSLLKQLFTPLPFLKHLYFNFSQLTSFICSLKRLHTFRTFTQ